MKISASVSCVVVLTFALARLANGAGTTIDETNKFAWSGNIEWINFAGDGINGVVTGELFLSGYAWAASAGWIAFGDGMPENGHAYANDSASDFGVNHDGSGNLSGLAWSANTGWINFGWASDSDPDRPRIDLRSGAFHGYAWSANTGWISLGTDILITDSLHLDDTDDDGIDDAWEKLHFGDLETAGSASDTDEDGDLDGEEYLAGTDPKDPESFFLLRADDIGDSHVTVEFPSDSSRLYRIDLSSDLGIGDLWKISEAGVFAPDPGDVTVRTIQFPASERTFFRVVPMRPLSAEGAPAQEQRHQ